MKFLSKHQQKTTTLPITANFKLENYICNTKFKIDEHLQEIFTTHEVNLTRAQEKALKELAYEKSITIKPADKNLGIVILNTEDYTQQCMSHLSSNTYTLVDSFPTSEFTQHSNQF